MSKLILQPPTSRCLPPWTLALCPARSCSTCPCLCTTLGMCRCGSPGAWMHPSAFPLKQACCLREMSCNSMCHSCPRRPGPLQGMQLAYWTMAARPPAPCLASPNFLTCLWRSPLRILGRCLWARALSTFCALATIPWCLPTSPLCRRGRTRQQTTCTQFNRPGVPWDPRSTVKCVWCTPPSTAARSPARTGCCQQQAATVWC
mmetsp:Transcript_27498/g.74376  ORF Transcript_27498/g.74376 Transcript_27498/m.74376 type:complete len:203 (+) Transcript_27498:448-1056(+)